MSEESEEFWQGSFGNEYTLRNNGDWDDLYKKRWNVTRTELNDEFIGHLDSDSHILEVGCNRGHQLQILEKQGFSNLWGLDINKKALKIARENKSFNLVEGSAFDLPFKDHFFDLVFTSGLLIHIHPDRLHDIIKETYRVTKKHIWCFEYYSEKCKEIDYRGNKNRLWKNDFKRLFLEQCSGLKVEKERKVKYVANDNVDMTFLLKRSEK